MALRDSPWWGDLLQELAGSSLDGLSDKYQVELGDLEAELGAVTGSGPVTEAPWWPEALRRVEAGGSIRSVARSFGTNPRRVRRGLTRAGVRGNATPNKAAAGALDNFRDQLGAVPDGEVAKLAGVSVDAVKGERRRLGIEPFRPPAQDGAPPPPVDPIEAELEAEAAPPRPRPKRRRYATEVPQIIRRPSSSSRRSLPRVSRSSVPDADSGSAGEAPERRPTRRLARGMPSLSAAAEAQPKRARRGRTRIVRNDEHDHEEIAAQKDAPPKRRRARKAKPLHGAVRQVEASDIDLTELVQDEGAPAVVVPIPEEPVVEAVAEDVAVPQDAVEEPSSEVVEAIESAELEDVTPAELSEAPLVEEPLVIEAAPEPATVESEVIEVAPPQAVELPASVQQALDDGLDLIDEGTLFGWQVQVGGEVRPFLIVAASWERALDLATQRLSDKELKQTSLQSIGPLLGASL